MGCVIFVWDVIILFFKFIVVCQVFDVVIFCEDKMNLVLLVDCQFGDYFIGLNVVQDFIVVQFLFFVVNGGFIIE